jgi:4-diphosphocytidyl-2-C-methyl-D-erythritol kinase
MCSKIQKNQILKASYAKINLFLKVLSKRKDGFHNICSMIHKIDLCDYLSFEPSSQLVVECDVDLGIEQTQNIVYKAAVALNEVSGENNAVHIKIEKNIPVGAGLGGGSSNAATTLLTLNELWDLNLEFDILENIASVLGSDVPFFLHDVSQALVIGKGDIVIPYHEKSFYEDLYYLLVHPNININTAKAYSLLNRDFDERFKDITIRGSKWDMACYMGELNYMQILSIKDDPRNKKNMFYRNDFEEVILYENPELLFLQYELKPLATDKKTSMTGSGSAFFSLFDDLERAQAAEKKIQKHFSDKNYKTFVGQLI